MVSLQWKKNTFINKKATFKRCWYLCTNAGRNSAKSRKVRKRNTQAKYSYLKNQLNKVFVPPLCSLHPFFRLPPDCFHRSLEAEHRKGSLAHCDVFHVLGRTHRTLPPLITGLSIDSEVPGAVQQCERASPTLCCRYQQPKSRRKHRFINLMLQNNGF